MYVHPEKKLVYLAHPRTASTATAAMLMKMGFELVGSHHSAFVPTRELPRCDADTFSVVRNHFDVIASWHAATLPTDRQHIEPMTQDDLNRVYIRAAEHMGPHTMYQHWFASDDVLRYETLYHDLGELLLKHGMEYLGLEKQNFNKRREGLSYQKLVPRQLAQRIYERFAEEINRLGYTYEGGNA